MTLQALPALATDPFEFNEYINETGTDYSSFKDDCPSAGTSTLSIQIFKAKESKIKL